MVGFGNAGGHQNAILIDCLTRQSIKRFRPMGVRSVSSVSVLGREKALSTMIARIA